MRSFYKYVFPSARFPRHPPRERPVKDPASLTTFPSVYRVSRGALHAAGVRRCSIPVERSPDTDRRALAPIYANLYHGSVRHAPIFTGRTYVRVVGDVQASSARRSPLPRDRDAAIKRIKRKKPFSGAEDSCAGTHWFLPASEPRLVFAQRLVK